MISFYCLKAHKGEEVSQNHHLSYVRCGWSLSKISSVGHLCFNSIKQVNTWYKMNEIANKMLLAGNLFLKCI